MGIDTIVDIIMAVLTAIATLVALFGNHWNKKWFIPKLKVSLLSDVGDLICSSNGINTRYYHLKVSNDSKEAATDAIVMLTRIQEKKETGIKLLWQGRVPMNWRHGDQFPSIYRTIGPEEHCDLIAISEKGYGYLMLNFYPNNIVSKWNHAFDIILTCRVESLEKSTENFMIEVKWDGKWDTADEKMASHIAFKEIRQKVKYKKA